MIENVNVLFILSDSLRADCLGCYGGKNVKTPNIDSLAKDGLLFTTVYAENPLTIPSRTAMVSSCYTFTHRPWMPLLKTDIHIAEIMKKSGYTTAAFTNSPFNAKNNMNRGFDTFREYVQKNSPVSPKHYKFPDLERVDPNLQEWMESYTSHIERRLYALERGELPSDSPELLTREAINWLKKNAGKKPFFLWLDYFDPHEPWSPPPPYDEMYDPGYEGRLFPRPKYNICNYLTEPELNHIIALYKGCITQVDDQIGLVIETLDELGLMDDTLIIFSSDHGEPLGDHGTIRKNGVPMWDELTRIPLILKGPMIPKGQTRECLIDNTDITPTILGLLKIEHNLPSALLEGIDLTPLIQGEIDKVRDKVYMGHFTHRPYTSWIEGPLRFHIRSAIVTERYKFIDNCNSRIPGFPTSNELYDIKKDPHERNNLIEEEKEIANQLRNDLLRFIDFSFYKNYYNRLLPIGAHYY
jgi:arylsulfatase A-like enzyme